MEWLVWLGAAVSLVGLCGVLWCIVLVVRARRAGLPEEELHARLRKAVTLNLAALSVSMFGLVVVIVGVVLS